MVAIPFIMGAAAAGGAALLGASAFLTMAAFTVASTLGAYLFPSKMNVQNMKPASLSDFSYNQANEGAPVPLIYGTVKIAGNIIWYGNLKTVEEKQEVKGGKGHHSQSVVTGYKYYIDIWIALAMGQVSIIDTYNNEKKQTISCGNQQFNDGTGTSYPTEPGEYASALSGIAHIFYEQLYVGENTTILPTINYVLKRTLPTTINYANMDSGSNPAAVIYDILTEQLGINPTKIDKDNFNSAASYYNDNNLGINLAITSQKKGSELIKYIMQFVNSVCYKDQTTGLYKIKVLE